MRCSILQLIQWKLNRNCTVDFESFVTNYLAIIVIVIVICFILDKTTFDWPQSDGWIKANTDSLGFYRVNYDEANWLALTKQLNTDHKVDLISLII